MRHPTKTTICQECGASVEYTSKVPKRCKPCAKIQYNRQQTLRRRKKGALKRNLEQPDHLPEVDWLMRTQFAAFFDLVQTDYRKVEGVAS